MTTPTLTGPKVKNPNAYAALGSALGGSQLVMNIAKQFGWDLSAGWATLIAGGAAFVWVYLGRNGLTGIKTALLHGWRK